MHCNTLDHLTILLEYSCNNPTSKLAIAIASLLLCLINNCQILSAICPWDGLHEYDSFAG